jgi:hypothetical protein
MNPINSKIQSPSSNEAPSFKLQKIREKVLELGILNFSGAWTLDFGI